MTNIVPNHDVDIKNLTGCEIQNALMTRGYGDDHIVSTEFAGLNDQYQAMYDVKFDDTVSESIVEGRVFVFYDHNDQLVAEF